jgi:Transposase DDE domain
VVYAQQLAQENPTMFKDEHRRNVWNQIRQHGLRAFDGLLTGPILREAATRCNLPLGNGPLGLLNLTWLAIASALQVGWNFAEVLAVTLKMLQDADSWSRNPLSRACKPPGGMPGAKGKSRTKGKSHAKGKPRSKHDPRPADPAHLSEEAFCQARKKMPASYWIALILLLGEKFRAEHASLLTWRGYRLLAMDGTTINLCNWKRLREHFGVASNGKNSRTTQARMLMLTFPLARIPWKYELCPLRRSEKTSAAALLDGLCPQDLILMDKGFWSYGLFWQIADQQAFFAVRLFKSAKLKTVRRWAKNDSLASYAPSDRKWKNYPASMQLRVIRYQVRGFRATALVTNLLNRQISRQDWVGLATAEQAGRTLDNGLYHRRWEIETTFSEIKVHQQMEGRLRGRTPQAIEYEVAGHVLLYLLVRWLIVEAAAKAGVDPLRLSHLAAMHELGQMTPAFLTATSERASCVLALRLLERIASHEVPLRPGRHYPRPNDTKVRNKGRGHYRKPSKLSTAKA